MMAEVIMYLCMERMCPALYREPGFLLCKLLRGRRVSVTDGTKVYLNTIRGSR